MSVKQQAFIVVPTIIGVIAGVFGVVGYFVGVVIGMPSRLHMPLILHCGGIAVLAFGFFLMGWIFRYRKPSEILVSTYATIIKTIKRIPPENSFLRQEPLILQGLQRYVRHPMYFSVVVLFFGWWLVLGYTFLLFMTFFFFLWFNAVVIPFEEKELKALYGEKYEA